jgi:hypothetical protein
MGEGKYKGARPVAVNGRGNVGSSGKFFVVTHSHDYESNNHAISFTPL